MAGPETTVLALMCRLSIPANMLDRLLASNAPTYRAPWVKPSPEHSFASVDASSGGRRTSALERGFGASDGRLGIWRVSATCNDVMAHHSLCSGDLSAHRGVEMMAVSCSGVPDDGR